MADNKLKLGNFKAIAQKGLANIDMKGIKENAKAMTDTFVDKAVDIKDVAVAKKEDIADKITELDRMLEESITEYNNAYTLMSDKGMQLYIERQKAAEFIVFIETLINSIANKPKKFENEFEEININKRKFIDSCEFADKELENARKTATGAGLGLAAGASVACMAPSVAMWVATTYGTASTGTAIATLSGAAKTKAALAWLGRGAKAVGGKGVAGGEALLGLSGPLGMTIAGVTLLSSITVFSIGKVKNNKQKNKEIQAVKDNIEAVCEMDAEIKKILDETVAIRNGLNKSMTKAMALFGADYTMLSDEEKKQLGALVNNTKALSAMFTKTIGEE